MHPLLSSLLAQARTLPDTVVMIRAEGTALQQILGVAELIALLLAFALLTAAIIAAFRIRRSFEQARESLDEIGRDLRDLADNANRISRSITAVAESVSLDVASVHETVAYANKRARRAVTVLADRVDEFNRVVGSVQDSTQDAVITAIAALKGVRAGVRALRKRRPRRDDAAAPATPPAEATPPDLPARPRLRRRAREQD
jgi:methyl-accepting chemotaxis protein